MLKPWSDKLQVVGTIDLGLGYRELVRVLAETYRLLDGSWRRAQAIGLGDLGGQGFSTVDRLME